jgi:hypothetical protein
VSHEGDIILFLGRSAAAEAIAAGYIGNVITSANETN